MEFYENNQSYEPEMNMENIDSEPSQPESDGVSDFEGDFSEKEAAFNGAESEEAPQAPKSRRKKKAAEESDDQTENEAISEDTAAFYDGSSEDDFDDSEKSEDGASPLLESSDEPRRLKRSSRAPAVLDGEGRAIHDRAADNGQRELSILAAARNSRRVLSATLDGLEANDGAMPKAVFYLGPVKVMIPFSEMGLELGSDEIDVFDARSRISAMLGAKIYYMVRGIDMKSMLAGASRRDAMLVRQRTILNARNDDGAFRICEGTQCMAQVLQVLRFSARIEIYGMEVHLGTGSISNLWLNDVREVVKVGEEYPVEIVKLVRDENGRAISIEASMRLAEKVTPVELEVNHTYTGTINGYSDTAFFVKVSGVEKEIRCPITSNHVAELMQYDDLVKLYVRAIHDGVPTGSIVKILKRTKQTPFR